MSKLFLVPTPIGNLEDMTFRGIRILKDSDFILAEDTRISAKLLKHFEIETPIAFVVIDCNGEMKMIEKDEIHVG